MEFEIAIKGPLFAISALSRKLRVLIIVDRGRYFNC